MKIAFIGLGSMGAVIAALLLKTGHEFTAWNRSPEKAASLIASGAKAETSVEDAVRDAEVIFSMLSDDDAVEQVFFGSEGTSGILRGLRPGAVHVSLSTISVRLSRCLTEEHRNAGGEFVAAPVFGRPNVAADGKLWIVVGGSEAAVSRVRPLLEALSRGVTVISDEPWCASALKIGGNFMITAMIESVSEAMVFAEAHRIDPGIFIETVNQALFRSPLYEAYAKVMLRPPERPGATIAIGSKDMRLFREAADEVGIQTPLADRFAADLATASEAGLKDRDWAAGLYDLARSQNLQAR